MVEDIRIMGSAWLGIYVRGKSKNAMIAEDIHLTFNERSGRSVNIR